MIQLLTSIMCKTLDPIPELQANRKLKTLGYLPLLLLKYLPGWLCRSQGPIWLSISVFNYPKTVIEWMKSSWRQRSQQQLYGRAHMVQCEFCSLRRQSICSYALSLAGYQLDGAGSPAHILKINVQRMVCILWINSRTCQTHTHKN